VPDLIRYLGRAFAEMGRRGLSVRRRQSQEGGADGVPAYVADHTERDAESSHLLAHGRHSLCLTRKTVAVSIFLPYYF
jgi:hypothetical protein